MFYFSQSPDGVHKTAAYSFRPALVFRGFTLSHTTYRSARKSEHMLFLISCHPIFAPCSISYCLLLLPAVLYVIKSVPGVGWRIHHIFCSVTFTSD
jgi:hypothetical protein